MIKHNTNIAIGLSGGKDSMALLYALCKIREFSPIRFNLKAITLDPCFGGHNADYSKITKICEKLGVQHIIEPHPLWKIIFVNRKEKNPCSLCARMRHGIIHNICIKENCKSIALGHNIDDVVETFFMNLFFEGRISTFSPVSYLSRKDLFMIRPLIYCSEHEIINFISQKNLPICKSSCPIDGNTSRENIKHLIKNLEGKYPKLRKKIINSIESSHLNGW